MRWWLMAEQTDPRYTPEMVALGKRSDICSIGETEFAQWRHNPVTAGFLQYLEDQIVFLRDAAADMLEDGMFVPGHAHQDRNPDVLRGQILNLRAIGGLTIEQIKNFYAPPEAAEDEAAPTGVAYEDR